MRRVINSQARVGPSKVAAIRRSPQRVHVRQVRHATYMVDKGRHLDLRRLVPELAHKAESEQRKCHAPHRIIVPQYATYPTAWPHSTAAQVPSSDPIRRQWTPCSRGLGTAQLKSASILAESTRNILILLARQGAWRSGCPSAGPLADDSAHGGGSETP
jgi:hypothetical protein